MLVPKWSALILPALDSKLIGISWASKKVFVYWGTWPTYVELNMAWHLKENTVHCNKMLILSKSSSEACQPHVDTTELVSDNVADVAGWEIHHSESDESELHRLSTVILILIIVLVLIFWWISFEIIIFAIHLVLGDRLP